MADRKILELEATLKDTPSLAENSTEITNLKISLNRTVAKSEEESLRTKTQIDELQKRLDNAGKERSIRKDVDLTLMFSIQRKD